MRAALNILAIMAVLLSGFSPSDFRSVTGMSADASTETMASTDATPNSDGLKGEPCKTGNDVPDEGTSDCNATSAYLASTQATVFIAISPSTFHMTSDRANGFWPTPSKHPPKSSI